MKKEYSRNKFILWIIVIGIIILMSFCTLIKPFEDKSKVKINQKSEATNIKLEEIHLDKDVKELYNSKTLVINSSKEDKIKKY